jgi:tripartite-type tricarboxylate transporter receptor subunit TctC
MPVRPSTARPTRLSPPEIREPPFVQSACAALAISVRTPIGGHDKGTVVGSPTIPTIGDFLRGFEASSWHGIGAPRGTPTEIINALSLAINAGLSNQVIRARLADLGLTPLVLSPAEFGNFIADETDKWGEVIRAANIKAE